jgi:hypothetical protein
MRLSLNGESAGDPAHPDAAFVRIASRLDADDGTTLLQLLDLDRVVAVDQLPGQMTVSASGPLNGAVHVNGLAIAGGFSAAVEGALHLTGDGAPSGGLQVKVAAADLQPLHSAMTGEPGAVVPIAASATIGIADTDLSCTDLTVKVGKSSLHGRLDLKLGRPIGIDGDIAVNDVDAALVSAMLLGLPSAAAGSDAIWSSEPAGRGAFGIMSGAVDFKFDRTALTPYLVARDLKGVARFRTSEIALSGLDGTLAGGRLTGELMFRRDPENFGLSGHIDLVGADAALLLAPNKTAIDGRLTMKLQADGLGLSPDGLVSSLHGSGAVTLADGHFSGIDSAAFAAALAETGPSGAIDAAKIRAAVTAAMEAGRVAVPQGNAQVTITGGQIHLPNAVLQTDGGAALSLDGVLDLNNAALDARMTLSEPPPPNALIPGRPELDVTLKGPLAAPERKLDTSALVGWLTLRATELQTRRLESVEANRREEVLGPVTRPASPFIRFIPSGAALEAAYHANAAAAEPSPRVFDRLHPEGAPLSAAARVERGNAAAAALPATSAAKPAAPQSAPRSPLDLLFHSQN